MTCETCFYWYHDNHFGSCKRYPKVEVKNKNDWCGEFKEKLAVVSFPAYGESGEFLPAITSEEVGEMIKTEKKRGRPAKENK
jgi:hypothetical protein